MAAQMAVLWGDLRDGPSADTKEFCWAAQMVVAMGDDLADWKDELMAERWATNLAANWVVLTGAWKAGATAEPLVVVMAGEMAAK